MSIHTYIRRYTLFLTGVILSATGIAFITRAGLGTSPSIRSSVCSEPDTSISMGILHVFIQYDVPDAWKPFFAGNLPSSRLCRFR